MTDLFNAVAAGATVVTANNRLARILHEAYDQAQLRAGRGAWPSADILPWQAWLVRCWTELSQASPLNLPLLLSEAQEQFLWQRLIAEASGDALTLISLPATSSQAAAAWEALHDFKLAIAPAEWDRSPDTATFQAWAERFLTACRQAEWLSPSELAGALREPIMRRSLPVPAQVLLVGFQAFTPQQADLVAALRAAGTEVEEAPAPAVPEPRSALVAGYTDADEEMRAAAQWARELLSQGESGLIGVVVADLAARRASLERIFGDILQPQAILPGAGRESAAFNLSLGPALAAQPMIRAALLLLRAGFEPQAFSAASELLRSPYCGHAEQEWMARGQLEVELRRRGEAVVSLAAIVTQASRAGTRCPTLAAALRALGDVAARQPRRQAPRQWAQAFAQLLSAGRWPGERGLDSSEYQTARAWQELLEEFSRLDLVAHPMEATAALAALQQLAAARVFQPESPAARVQILGLLESSGLEFAHLWVMGLQDGAWPPAARPLPFLPLRAQIEAGVPHASARQEWEFARAAQARLLAAAPRVVLSYPRQEGELMLRPSPLLADLPRARPDDWASAGAAYSRRLVNTGELETFADEAGPPADAEQEHPGGTAVLRDQAACPFRAFAHWRLGAQGLEPPPTSLDGRARGQLVHACLNRFWQALRRGHEEEPIELPPAEQVAERLGAAVAAVLEAAPWPPLRQPRFADAERRRLIRLLCDWIEACERPRFPLRVAEHEGGHIRQVAGLRLRVRVDRIDRLADGQEIVLDYKTGDVSLGAWQGERPDEPQLPLYAAFAEPPPAAAVYAQLKPGKLGFSGAAASDGLVAGVKAAKLGWTEQLAAWRAALERLAQDFLAGVARVDPKQAATCAGCDTMPLCRITEFGKPLATSEAEATEE